MLGDSTYSSPHGYRAFFSTPFTEQGHHGGTAILQRFRQFLGRPVRWWNAACTNAVRDKREAFSRLRRHRGDLQCLDAFRRCRARARRVLKEAQRASWKAYVSSINVHTTLRDLFNKVR
ncbi:hypothetical protein E2C01_046406 [Portunus trituberculatus]|uniref:Uncharacterized protein n=1 Tax=Portunus trituberculatus TaxID=210409 RepID=A0A5B7G536_PORTR|nr:hypothetical protein [Portunus trituberculatus]